MEDTDRLESNLGTLSQVYPFDGQTRTFTIPVRLASYRDFFNPMDPSPAPRRDLALDLAGYLNQCSEEIPGKYQLAVTIEVQQDAPDPHREQECLDGLRSFYRHELFLTQAQMRHKRGQALKYLMVSLLCLAFYLVSSQWTMEVLPWNLLREAVLIGGWVFMWEAVTLNFIEMDEFTREMSRCRRLIQAQASFHHPSESVKSGPTG